MRGDGWFESSRRCLLMRAWVLSYTRDVSHTIAATVTRYLFEASRLNHGAPMRSTFLVGTRPAIPQGRELSLYEVWQGRLSICRVAFLSQTAEKQLIEPFV